MGHGAKHSPLELSASRGLLRFFMVGGVLGATLSHRTRRTSHPATSDSVLCHGRSLRNCWFLFRAVRAISADMRAPNLPRMMLQGLRCVLGLARVACHALLMMIIMMRLHHHCLQNRSMMMIIFGPCYLFVQCAKFTRPISGDILGRTFGIQRVMQSGCLDLVAEDLIW